MLTTLLRTKRPAADPTIIELNADGYIVSEIQHSMKRASTIRFSVSAGLGDTSAMTNRQPVKFTLGGVILFAGRTLPATRRIDASRDEIEYLAGDVLEYLATNPIVEENEWYNRPRDANIYPYPTDVGIRSIIETEFVSIVGTGKTIGAFDWTSVPAATQALVIYNFQTRGKTWLGLLESIAGEVPTLGWWYDPSTTSGSDVDGGTLRFYDLSKTTGTTAEATIARRDGVSDGHPPTVESVEVSIDISQSYDKITLHGWGNMTEIQEQATPAWDYTRDGTFTSHRNPVILRDSASYPGRVEQFSASVSGGAWALAADSSSSNPYFALSTRQVNRDAYRKYKVSHPIINLRLTRDDSVSPPRYVSAERSMWVYRLQYGWDVGPIGFAIDGGYYLGSLNNGVKNVLFTNGIKDDFGYVRPEPGLYPNYPSAPLPLFEMGTPAAFEENYFTLQNPLVIKTSYYFDGVSPSADDYTKWTNIADTLCYCYWGYGDPGHHSDLYLLYTAGDDLTIEVSDSSLGYSKHLELWDQRFFKYTNIAGTVIRDDTTMLTAYANALFALVSRKRVYGSITVIAQPSEGFTAHPMGSIVRMRNWGSDGATYDLPVIVQSLRLTDLRDAYRLSVGFDSSDTFHSLDITTQFRQYFEANQVYGTSGITGNTGSTGSGWGGNTGGGGNGSNGNTGGNSGGGGGDGYNGSWLDCCNTSGSDAETDGSGSGSGVPP